MNWLLRWVLASMLVLPVGGMLGASVTTTATAGTSTKITLPAGSYTLHVPPGEAPAQGWPFIFADHGANLGADNMEAGSGLNAAGDAAGYVVLYGQAQNGRWDAGFCCVGSTDTAHRDDVAWHRLIAADAAMRAPLDLTRGYAAGFSNGAMMAWRLACDAPDLVKSAVVVAGSLTKTCSAPVKVLRLHDKVRDSTVPYCQTATVTTPRIGCPGFEQRVFWSAWRVNTGQPGSTIKVEETTIGHRWPTNGGQRAVDWFQNGV